VELARGELEGAGVEAVGLLSLMGSEEALPLPLHDLIQELLQQEGEGRALSLFQFGIDLIEPVDRAGRGSEPVGAPVAGIVVLGPFTQFSGLPPRL
jgi:hypothetical protein